MEYRTLGNTDLRISAITLGAWQYGKQFWSGIEDDESLSAIRAALDAGINAIDTAVGYGGGHSEEIVGRAVAGRRDEVILLSKCWSDPAQIPSQIDACLARMGIECIDVYQVHYPSPSIPVCDTIGAMAEIQRAGKIRHIGVSNFDLKQMEEAAATARIEVCQPPYNVFWREIDDGVLPFCIEHNIAVLPYSPLAQGLLAGRFRRREDVPDDIRANSKLLAPEVLDVALPIVDRLAAMAETRGKTVAQAAIAWTLNVPGITSAIVGARTAGQARENVGGVGWKLTDAEQAEVADLGLTVHRMLDYSSNIWGWKPS